MVCWDEPQFRHESISVLRTFHLQLSKETATLA